MKYTYARQDTAILTADLNMHGTLFGGRMLSMMDILAAISANKMAGKNCVTANINDVQFTAPIKLGDIITLEADVAFVANKSMVVYVRATKDNGVIAAEAFFTFVALDQDLKPIQISLKGHPNFDPDSWDKTKAHIVNKEWDETMDSKADQAADIYAKNKTLRLKAGKVSL